MKSSQISLLVLALGLFAATPLMAGERGEGHGHGKRGGPARAMFNKLDTDGDGQISIAEATRNAAERTRAIDANGDGVITVQEVQAHREKLRAERAAARFAKLDSNGDGVVSAAEFTEAQTRKLKALDANGDGVVSAEEARSKRGGHGKRRGERAHRGEH